MSAVTLTPDGLGQKTGSKTAWWKQRIELPSEALILLCSAFFALFNNSAFWHGAISNPMQQWRLALSLFLIVTAVHAFLLGWVVNRWTAKPLLTALLLVTAVASHYMNAYGVYLDADMLRNVLHTDSKESGELLTWWLLVPLALTAFPVALLWRVQLRRRKWPRALAIRSAFLLGALLAGAAGALMSSQGVSSLIRNHREVRYLVTPANYLVSLVNVMQASPPGPKRALLPVGLDARQDPRPAGSKPRLLVLVVGETARAQNWGLNGYARQTTPELSRIEGLLNFSDVTSCGSSTEVSLPCMFSPYGRRDYDERKIRSHQSLLHVLDHAGIGTLWRDNQSGCKGVCDGLTLQRLQDSNEPGLCNGKRCLDGILLKGLEAQLSPSKGDRVVVLHQLGNHGPSYFERYPLEYKRFTPTCENPELGQCARQEIVNAYDNALLYTDHFLAETIAMLKSRTDYDTALIYVSDHGESLGEKGLFLHGVPYSIAPAEQIKVPMVMWLSPGLVQDARLDTTCLKRETMGPASHDNLFPSVLGLMQVSTREYQPAYDLFAKCRNRQ
ncbi:lipid A ethanolaminephosphotransferase [Pseudoxanthomonas sp. CF125]|nr:lipid A ethanolaminephosphotransferase [Pseudoxanthomonas sp. CF125]